MKIVNYWKLIHYWILIVPCLFCSLAIADGSSIDTVYLPYVQPLEKELEYQLLYEDKDRELDKEISQHKFSYGQAIASRLFMEASLSFTDADSLELASYEIEAIYQLTEQGEYQSDWGVLLELEKSDGESVWETSIGMLNNYNWRRWQFTTNLLVEFEWGNDINDEIESAFASKSIYRYRPEFEPGIEIFIGEDTLAFGPTVGGLIRTTSAQKFRWSASLLFGNRESPERTFKLELDYEFY